MKLNQQKYLTIALYGLIVIIIGALVVMLLFALRDFFIEKRYAVLFRVLNPFIIGAVMAYLLYPLTALFEQRVFNRMHGKKRDAQAAAHTRRLLSVMAAFITTGIAIALISIMVFPQVGASVNQLASKAADLFSPAQETAVENLPDSIPVPAPEAELEGLLAEDEDTAGYDALMNTKLGSYILGVTASVQHTLSDFGFQVDIEQSLSGLMLAATAEITALLGQYYQTILNATAEMIITTARQLINILIGVVAAFYILSDKERLFSQGKRLVYALFPTAVVQKATHVINTTHRTFYGFITAKLLDSVVVGIICFLFMSIFRIHYPMLISVIIGITNVIPFFGPIIGAIPSILFLSINDIREGIVFVVFILVLQQVDGNIIGPKIIGNTIGLSSFWVVFAILVFSGLMGPLGMFIGVPLFAVIYTLLKEFAEARLGKKGLPDNIGISDEPLSELPSTDILGKDPSAARRFHALIENITNNINAVINKTRHHNVGVIKNDEIDEG
jgi:predicted PurR-regulated permease PerM